MRCFFACLVETESVERLKAACPTIAGVRWVARENLHVTLHFVGTVADKDVDALRESVRGVHGHPTTCQVDTLTGYPNSLRARVVVAQLTNTPSLATWSSQLQTNCRVPGERVRSFKPHITLARSKQGVHVPEAKEIKGIELNLRPPALYQSQTLPEGPRYTQL